MKLCKSCQVEKADDEFYGMPGTKYVYGKCKKCYAKAVHERRRQTGRRREAYRKYGMQLEDYVRMLKKQAGSCAICGSTVSGGRGGRMQVDHCHNTGKVRGLLCARCNRGLACFKDSANLLRLAARYIDD